MQSWLVLCNEGLERALWRVQRWLLLFSRFFACNSTRLPTHHVRAHAYFSSQKINALIDYPTPGTAQLELLTRTFWPALWALFARAPQPPTSPCVRLRNSATAPACSSHFRAVLASFAARARQLQHKTLVRQASSVHRHRPPLASAPAHCTLLIAKCAWHVPV